MIATGGAAAAVAASDACAQIAAHADSLSATLDRVEPQLAALLPPGTLKAVAAILNASRDRVIADLYAASAACSTATSTTVPSTTSSTSTTVVSPAACTDLAAQKAAANVRFDAAEAELTRIITGNELLAAVAALDAARAQTNAGIDAAIAACASAPTSTLSTTPTNVPPASCVEIHANRTTFNSELDAAEAQLRVVLAAGSQQLITAINGIEVERARGNAEFDAGLSACAPPEVPAKDVALADRINAFVSRAVEEGKEPGVSVAVSSQGRMILEKGYGHSDVEAGAPATPKTIYRIGSITKQFTAAAIMDLAEHGRLSVDDEVTKYLPDYPTHGYRITLRHLLTHTSGITDYTELDAYKALGSQKASRDDIVKMFSEAYSVPPGRVWAYSNSNYFLLGLIIEKITGQSYATYMSEHIFSPLHMDDTSYCPDEPTGPNQAKPYKRVADHTFAPLIVDAIDNAYASGGLCSTVEDLARWNDAFHNHRFLTLASYNEMTTPATLDDGRTTRYGFGLFLSDPAIAPIIFHGGWVYGFQSYLAYLPARKVTVVVLVNNDPPSDGFFTLGIAGLLPPP